MKSPVDVTYLADAVILLRFFEADGSVRRAISVIKKRTGKHEDTIREFWIDDGLHVGEPLVQFQGVLRGTPRCRGDRLPLASGGRRVTSASPATASPRAGAGAARPRFRRRRRR